MGLGSVGSVEFLDVLSGTVGVGFVGGYVGGGGGVGVACGWLVGGSLGGCGVSGWGSQKQAFRVLMAHCRKSPPAACGTAFTFKGSNSGVWFSLSGKGGN